MEMMKVEILSRDLVKPSSPTPAHLKDYKLCLLDQFYPEFHCGIIFFYSSPPNWDKKDTYYHCRILKKSLSETLTDFYPIAGRFKDTSAIDCNDEGACIVEAKINRKLSDFLMSQPSDDLLKKLANLVPSSDSVTMELASNCILIAQLTMFECGGTAICFSLMHRFCDLASVVVLLKNWSARARGDSNDIVFPDFVASSFLPPHDLPPLPQVPNLVKNFTSRRLVFEASKISALKKKFIALESDSSSRVEVVLALILKCAISAARSIDKSAVKKSGFSYAVNLRRRTTPPLPENSIGNLIWMIIMEIEGGIEFHELVNKMKSETASFFDETACRIKGDEEGNSLVFESMKRRGEVVKTIGDMDFYPCTSWCRFPFYEVDFGWGKPVWVSSGIMSSNNFIVLEDTMCGTGVQAWVTLDPKVMDIFERDEELSSFASFNPNILT